MDEPATHPSWRDSLSKTVANHLVIPAALLVQIIVQESCDLVMRGLDTYDKVRDAVTKGPARERQTDLQ